MDGGWREDVEIDGERHRSPKLAEELAQKAGTSLETAVDAIRYFVLREVAFGLDGDFSHAALMQRFNSDLANDLGNLLSRTLTMLQRYCQGTVPQPTNSESATNMLAEAAAKLWPDLDPLLNELAFHRALARLWEYVRLVNRYVDEQAPWALARDPAQRRQLDTVLYNQVESLRIIALLALSFYAPYGSIDMAPVRHSEDETQQRLATARMGGIPPWNSIQPGAQLFPRIEAGRSTTKGRAPAQGRDHQRWRMPATVSYEDFQKLDLRVGRIVRAEPVPKANKLLKIDGGRRTGATYGGGRNRGELSSRGTGGKRHYPGGKSGPQDSARCGVPGDGAGGRVGWSDRPGRLRCAGKPGSQVK